MNGARIFSGYLAWHYGAAFLQMAVVWKNLLWFVVHFFSIPLLLRTLFSEWRRIHEDHHRGAGFEDYFSTIVVNFLSRIVGAFVRLIVIISGLVFLLLTTASIILFVIFWLFAPIVLSGMFVYGIVLLLPL